MARTANDWSKLFHDFWTNPRVQALSDEETLLLLYLIGNKHSNVIGYYWLPGPYIEADLRWKSDQVHYRMAAVERARFVAYDAKVPALVVLPWFKHNNLINENQLKRALQDLSKVPVSPLDEHFAAGLSLLPPRIGETLAKELHRRRSSVSPTNGTVCWGNNGDPLLGKPVAEARAKAVAICGTDLPSVPQSLVDPVDSVDKNDLAAGQPLKKPVEKGPGEC